MTTGKKKRQWVLAEFCGNFGSTRFSMPFGVCVHVQHCIPPNARRTPIARMRMSCMRSRALATSNAH